MSNNYHIGQIVEIEITQPGWECIVESTIVGIIRHDGGEQTDYILAITFNLFSQNDSLEGETGFTQIHGRTVTTHHAYACTVRRVNP